MANRQSRRAAKSSKPTPKARKAAVIAALAPVAANSFRGEAKVEIGGREVLFCITIGAMADLSEALGVRNNIELFQRLTGAPIDHGDGNMQASGPAMADLPAIVHALSNGEVSVAEARALGLGDLQRVVGGVGRAVALAFPQEREGKKGVAGAAS